MFRELARAEFGPDINVMESGLGFEVDFDKSDFIDSFALKCNLVVGRRKLVGLHF